MTVFKMHFRWALSLTLLVLPTLVFAQSQTTQPDTPAPLPTPDGTLLEYTLPVPEPPVRTHHEPQVEALSVETPEPDPLVESASNLRLPLSEIASSVEIITAADIAARKAQTLPEILQGAMGLDLVQKGGPGQLATVLIRGADSKRTLVMLNGMPITDIMAPGRLTDISKLSLTQVERIEIVKGPQSVAHGSGALGGIINIITAQADENWQGQLTAESGSFNSWLGKVQTSGTTAGVGVVFGAALENTQGFSAARRSPGFSAPQPVPAMDRDGYRGVTLDLSLDYQPAEGLDLRLTNRYMRTESELDVFGGDDPNYLSRYDQFVQQLQVEWDTLPKAWEQTFHLGWNQTDRVYDNPVDAQHPVDRFQGDYQSRIIQGDWQHHLRAGEWGRLVVGAGYQEEAGAYEECSAWSTGTGLPAESATDFGPRSAHLVSLYTEEHLRWQAFTATLGVRYDQHDQFGGFTTYRVTPAYHFAGLHTRLKGSWGTGFNAPSLFQLYSTNIYAWGNPELQPETSTGWDVGLEQTWFEDRLRGGITYFRTKYQDQIKPTYDSATFRSPYQNLEQVETKGWESSIRVAPLKDMSIRVSYTKLTANEIDPGGVSGTQPLPSRADFKLGGEVRYRWQGVTAQLQINHVGPRWGYTWGTGNVRLDPYTLVDATVTYEYQKLGEVYLKLRNLLDTSYEVVSGYTVAPFAAFVGVTVRWL